MIAEDIEKIRLAEDDVKRKISEAEQRSKESVEVAKRKIIEAIDERRKKLIEEIEKWKRTAEREAKIEAEKIIEDYRKKASDIRSIGEERISEVASEVLNELIG